VLVNTTVFKGAVERNDVHVIEIPATDLAVDVGNIMTASVVMAGALSAATGLVSMASLVAAVSQCLPSYRSKHIAINERALQTGFEAVAALTDVAWPAAATAAAAALSPGGAR
jgi:2-oxoglutarate ferredoxin oxidoreductase subunit gamma